MTWRVGRKVGRTIYHQLGDQPSTDDLLIGVMDTPRLAEQAVAAVNLYQAGVVADAWDEGYNRGVRDEAGEMEPADNPYRDP